MALPPILEQVINKLPDPTSTRVFVARLFEEQEETATRFVKNEELMVDLFTIAAYSHLLSETLLQRPEYISWLARERERDLTQIKNKETLLEDLARFVSINHSLSESIQLARFKRRELLRIYLRDCLNLATLSETTTELSYLADSIMERALQVCYQPLLKRYGMPQVLDESSRFMAAEFAIIGLGKLGSFELNYSSDIDLIFIYSGDGETSGAKESVSNKYFFTKLAESLVKTISSPLGEGAVFRVDMRLRPRGREGDLVASLAETLRYYKNEAQNWERQALIRARSCAGNNALVEKLLTQLHNQIYKPEPLIEALKSVKQTKEKIDKDVAKRSGGYNVKLGKGGIREIEFIVQALQICYGGQDAWLCAPQTLIGLQRLTDKNLLSDNEHTQLSQAYVFLRTVEHRLQMEHGLQTHSLPSSDEKLLLLARRCSFETYKDFEQCLNSHCQNVQDIYNRVFGQTEIKSSNKFNSLSESVLNISRQTQKNLVARVANIESLFQEALLELTSLPNIKLTQTEIAEAIALGLNLSVNPARALRKLKDFFLALKAENEKNLIEELTAKQIQEITIIGSNSQYFSQILMSQPRLFSLLGRTLDESIENLTQETFYQKFSVRLKNFSLDQAATDLRLSWHEEILTLGRYDLFTPKLDAKESLQLLRKINVAQTSLAEACLKITVELVCNELLTKFSATGVPITYSILGLGRLGHSGIDYNSDLDIVFVYSDELGSVVKEITNQEFFAKLVTLIVQTLSVLKREGTLYRLDLRLRPEGKNGLLATSFEKLQNYLQERAAIWELLAYLKVRAVAGDANFCYQVESRVLEILFSRSAKEFSKLSSEIKDMRLRLQNQKANINDFKFGIGGMLDVYFATRYLQLKHQVPDPENRGTLSLVRHLAEKNLLTEKQASILQKGYAFLRLLDHKLRLQLEQPQTHLPDNSSQRLEIAKQLGYEEEASFLKDYKEHLLAIREIYQEIV